MSEWLTIINQLNMTAEILTGTVNCLIFTRRFEHAHRLQVFDLTMNRKITVVQHVPEVNKLL